MRHAFGRKATSKRWERSFVEACAPKRFSKRTKISSLVFGSHVYLMQRRYRPRQRSSKMCCTNLVPLLKDGSFTLKFQYLSNLFQRSWHLRKTRHLIRNSGSPKFIFIAAADYSSLALFRLALFIRARFQIPLVVALNGVLCKVWAIRFSPIKHELSTSRNLLDKG